MTGGLAGSSLAPRRHRSPIDRAAAAVDGAGILLRAVPHIDAELTGHVEDVVAALARAVGRIVELQDATGHPLALRRREVRRAVGTVRRRLTLVDGGKP